MLTRTFTHLDGIGAHSEKELWRQGCHQWQDFLDQPHEFSIGSADREQVLHGLERSAQALSEGRYQHFGGLIGQRSHWKAWPEFRSSALYLDIETDGGTSGKSITMIGLYDGKEFTCLTRDEGLGAFPDILSRHSMVVTFWGSGFDLPMLRKLFPSLAIDQLHVDLCYAFRQAGMKGGLKSIEKQLGISRVEEAEGLTGRDAIWLWQKWERGGDQAARDTLIAYNREDVVNMERLAEIAYDMLSHAAYDAAGLPRPF